jgi:hypothetical protein
VAGDPATELNELAELTTLQKSLHVISSLTRTHDESRVGISSVGGVEAIFKVLQTFPMCEGLHWPGYAVIDNLTCCSIGRKKALACGGLQALLAAANNHLDSQDVCILACRAITNIVNKSRENTQLLISLGGATAVLKLREEWESVEVRNLAKLIGTEIHRWADEDCWSDEESE